MKASIWEETIKALTASRQSVCVCLRIRDLRQKRVTLSELIKKDPCGLGARLCTFTKATLGVQRILLESVKRLEYWHPMVISPLRT